MACICFNKIEPIKNPLKTKNTSTPIVPKNLIANGMVSVEFGASKTTECEHIISSIAVALIRSKPNIRCVISFNRFILKTKNLYKLNYRGLKYNQNEFLSHKKW